MLGIKKREEYEEEEDDEEEDDEEDEDEEEEEDDAERLAGDAYDGVEGAGRRANEECDAGDFLCLRCSGPPSRHTCRLRV